MSMPASKELGRGAVKAIHDLLEKKIVTKDDIREIVLNPEVASASERVALAEEFLEETAVQLKQQILTSLVRDTPPKREPILELS